MGLTRFIKRRSILVFILLLIQSYCFGQQNEFNSDLINYSSTTNLSAKKFAPEKLYLQFDKSYYTVGDTIWFKGYLLNAPSLMLSAKSGLLHIDISNDSGRLIKQYLFPVK